MKGYKALDNDMKSLCGNMEFELGKRYTVSGKAALCRNGFHFCEKIEHLNIHCDIKSSRIFEIEAYGDIKSSDTKCAAKSIQLVRELTKKEINEYFKQNQQELIKSEYSAVRMAVAQQGYGLEVLVNDEYWGTRMAVARQGYGLDILVHDKDPSVSETAKKMIAINGIGLPA